MSNSEFSPSVYDSHQIIDTFYRYWQNNNLLSLLTKYIGNVEDEKQFDIGFSGRLGLFSCLSSKVYALNPSVQQLSIGKSLLPQLRNLLDLWRMTGDKNNFNRNSALKALPWLVNCSVPIQRKIVNDLKVQMQVLDMASKSPKECDLVTLNSYLRSNMPGLNNDQFHAVLMIDVLPHLNDLQTVFSEISRVLRHDGHTIITYFPFRESGLPRIKNHRFVDEIFELLAKKYHADFQEIYDYHKHEVYPSKIGKIIKEEFQKQEKMLFSKYWLDLPYFKLQDFMQIATVVENAGLKIIQHIDVPGGMYRAIRRLMVLAKD